MTLHVCDVAVKQLRKSFSGEVMLAGDPAYDGARPVFNAMIDKRPAVIAQCHTVHDVVRAIRFARELDLEIAVRGGGHGVAGTALSDGGIVIDLRRMNRVTVDPDARTATAAGGTTMRDFDTATAVHGLATTGGRVSTTGIGGLTLGGGSGWLDRQFGLACDNLLEVQLVTAEGAVVRAAANENPDLFWALHGGGGNFGVATSFTFRLHPLTTVTAALLFWEPAAARSVMCAYRDFLNAAPNEVGGAIQLHTAPDKEFVPRQLAGKLSCTALVTYTGREANMHEVLRPMLALRPAGQKILHVPYVQLQCMLDDPPGYRNYWSADYLDVVPDVAIELFCARAAQMIVPSPSAQVLVPLGGAVAQGPSDYPLAWRHARWHVLPAGLWADPADDERARRWARELRADIKPWTNGSVYLNFIGDEGFDRVIDGVGAQNYLRLAAVKAQYDPGNVFHLNHNIRPAQKTSAADRTPATASEEAY